MISEKASGQVGENVDSRQSGFALGFDQRQTISLNHRLIELRLEASVIRKMALQADVLLFDRQPTGVPRSPG